MSTSRTMKRKPLPNTVELTRYHIVQDDQPAISEVAEESHQKSNASEPELSRTDWLIMVATVLGCTALILVAVAYLTFIWFGGSNSIIWTSIILSNWTATSVAICAVGIRWMTGIQMMLCTSILAWSILLGGVPLMRLPRISTLRYNNAGPLDLVLLLYRRPIKGIHLHLFLVICLSIMTTVLLQFSSTLLLSDLAAGPVRSFVNTTNNPVMPDSSDYSHLHLTDVVSTTSPSYPLFAESSQQNASRQLGNGPVDDTGPAVRALIPVTAEQHRSKLLSFEGNATLYDARWVCTRPFLANLSLTYSNDELLVFQGRANHSVHVPQMPVSNYLNQFSCILPRNVAYYVTEWPLLTCRVSNYALGIASRLENSNTSFGESWVVLNATSLVLDPLPYLEDIGWRTEFGWMIRFDDSDQYVTTANGPWTHLKTTQEDGYRRYLTKNHTDDLTETIPVNWTFAFDISLCSSAHTFTKNMYIRADQIQVTDEPVSLAAGLVQIDATLQPQTLQQRGVMTLNDTELAHQLMIERESTAQLPISSVFSMDDSLIVGIDRNIMGRRNSRLWYYSSDILYHQYSDTVVEASEDRSALFQHVIRTTNSPALAMQSLLHTVFTDRYYKYMPRFVAPRTQQLIYSIDAIHPVRIRGFIAVMAGVTLHFSLVTYVLIVFGVSRGIKQTLCSIDQAWHTFTQVAELQEHLIRDDQEVENTLRSATATDLQVRETLQRQGLRDEIFVLDDSVGGGSLRFRPRRIRK